MNKRRVLLAALAATGLGAGAARAKSREEGDAQYRRRTDDAMISDQRFERLSRDMQPYTQAARATAALDGKEDDLDRLPADPRFRRVQALETARLGDVRHALDTIERVNPTQARQLRSELDAISPKRDRDVKEGDLANVGALLTGGAALIATRGRSRSARQAIARALKVGGAAALGGGLGAAAANADRAVLSGDDMGDIGKAAAVAGGIGLAAAGGRAGIQRALRAALVRKERIAQRMADVPDGPALDALGARETAQRTARKGVPLFESDNRILADDIVHMERTIEMAGLPRVFTAANDPKTLARELSRRGDWKDMQPSMDALEQRYRAALKALGADARDAPSLRIDDPFVTDPRAREGIESQVSAAVKRRNKRRTAQRRRRRRERRERDVGEME